MKKNLLPIILAIIAVAAIVLCFVFNGQKGDLQKQVDDLKGQVSTQNSRISTLQKENANLQKQVNEYKPKADRWDRSMNSR